MLSRLAMDTKTDKALVRSVKALLVPASFSADFDNKRHLQYPAIKEAGIMATEKYLPARLPQTPQTA